MSVVRAHDLHITLIQTSTVWHDARANREMFSRWLDQVPESSRLVLLPEMFNSGFSMAVSDAAEPMSGPTVQWLTEQAVQRNKYVCGSLAVDVQGCVFNRFICASPDGAMMVYDKRHLFRMAGEHQHYVAGEQRVVMSVDGWRVCPMVCYDLRFPVWCRNRGDYDVLICVANWPAARRQGWDVLLRARAIENQVYVAAVNIVGVDGNGVSYSGGSAVYSPEGQRMTDQVESAGLLQHKISQTQLKNLRDSFPVWQDADKFELTR